MDDPHCLRSLYQRHAAPLSNVAGRFLNEPADVEDLVHDVFLEAWDRASSYDPRRGSVRAWLSVRMRSRCLDHLRSAAITRRRPLEAAAERAWSGDLEARADAANVRRLVAGLRPRHREVVELSYFGGLTHPQIAAHLAVPVGTVKSRMASAIQALRLGVGTQRAPIR